MLAASSALTASACDVSQVADVGDDNFRVSSFLPSPLEAGRVVRKWREPANRQRCDRSRGSHLHALLHRAVTGGEVNHLGLSASRLSRKPLSLTRAAYTSFFSITSLVKDDVHGAVVQGDVLPICQRGFAALVDFCRANSRRQ